MSFRNFQPLPVGAECAGDAFYQAPPGYRQKALHESLSKDKKKNREGGGSGRLTLDEAFGGLEEEDFLL